jgi:Leucine-rich repeat (LRR) protein
MESIHAGYSLEQGRFGLRAILTADWNPSVQQALCKHPIAELELNRGKGWHGSDLSFVSDFPELLSLSISGKTADSLSAIHALHNLRALDVMAYDKTELRFDEFPHLTECALEWRPKAMSLFGCMSLRKLYVKGFTGPTAEPFGRVKNLESLAILGSPISNLEGLRPLIKLRSLRLGDMRQLEALRGIETLTALEKLEINTCRKIRSIEDVRTLLNLRELYLDRLGDVQSLKALESLGKLRRLTFVDSTNILDGDLSPLLAVPHLDLVSFRNRKHYTHRRENFGHSHVTSIH